MMKRSFHQLVGLTFFGEVTVWLLSFSGEIVWILVVEFDDYFIYLGD